MRVTTVEFPTKAAAVCEESPDTPCADDDHRLKTVRFSSDTPEYVIEDAQRRAQIARLLQLLNAEARDSPTHADNPLHAGG